MRFTPISLPTTPTSARKGRPTPSSSMARASERLVPSSASCGICRSRRGTASRTTWKRASASSCSAWASPAAPSWSIASCPASTSRPRCQTLWQRPWPARSSWPELVPRRRWRRSKANNMSIQLSPEAEALIRELVERGDYDDPETVVAEALRALVERKQLARLKAAIAIGDEQAARGQFVPWTPDFLDRLKREAAENVRLGRPFKDEVIP